MIVAETVSAASVPTPVRLDAVMPLGSVVPVRFAAANVGVPIANPNVVASVPRSGEDHAADGDAPRKATVGFPAPSVEPLIGKLAATESVKLISQTGTRLACVATPQ